MNPRLLLGIAVAALAASGCGLKGPLYLPEKSDVTIRPAPAAPEAPAEPAPTAEPRPAPEPAQKPEEPPKDPPAGPHRG